MSTNTSTGKHKHRKDKAGIEFKTDAVVEGRVPIKPEDEVDIQGAREILEMHSQQNMGKAYKVKIFGTDTRLIIKRKSVVGSAPRELSLLCTEVYRFFIFARDPKLVILVVPEKPDGNRAYLLLKMRSESDANRVCNVIQNGRKNLASQAPPSQTSTASPGKARTSAGEEMEVEMQENGKSSDKPSSYEVESESEQSESEGSDTVSASSVKKDTNNNNYSAVTPTSTPKVESSRKISNGTAKMDEIQIEQTNAPEVKSAFPAMLDNSDTSSERGPKETSPKSLQRTPLYGASPASKPRKEKKRHQHRREAPRTEEMYVEPPKNWKIAQPIYARREAELREALLVDSYDDDWAVDVKLIKTDGGFGSYLSESGNVYMFTAHHLIPENYSHFDCSSSSEDEIELKEKPMRRSNGSTSGYVGVSHS